MHALSVFSSVPLSALMAWSDPTWSDKEMLLAVGSTVGAMIPVVLFVVRFATSWARAKTRRAEAEGQKADKELVKVRGELAALRPQMVELTNRLDQTQTLKGEAEADADKYRQLAGQRHEELEELRASLIDYESDLTVERRRVGRAVRKDGQTWNEKRPSQRPGVQAAGPGGPAHPDHLRPESQGRRRQDYHHRQPRRGAEQAGLSRAAARPRPSGVAHRPVLVRLAAGRTVQAGARLEDFLAASFGAESPSLLDYTVPILSGLASGLVPTSDNLAYAETNLTICWLLREGNRDPRFLLRRELQLKRITNAYDIVLMDCPPLLNICCVNALAASDYVMVPIMPSQQATARVPVLLRRLKDFRENINTQLKIMGVVVNRTHRSELTADEENRLTLLRVQCQDIWGQAVPQFGTFIRQNAQIRAAEDEHSQPCSRTTRCFSPSWSWRRRSRADCRRSARRPPSQATPRRSAPS